MVPKVTVPMDFGRHLLRSPTHNNLTLKTKEGGEVTASSVILSFNSPVIDHMTTTLHMTSVDMLEFSEAAVRMFVDSAYSGTADEITRETFRDLNKISSVFKVEWLVEKCSQYFSDLSESVKVPTYADLLYLFEEGAFELENLNRKHFLKITFEKIADFDWKGQFFEEYLVNADRLSTQKLDLVIELAGNDVGFIVQILTGQLSELSLNQGLPTYCKYLLENSDLSLCRQSNGLMFDALFELLDDLPDSMMRWTYSLLKKNSKTVRVSCDKPTSYPSLSPIPLAPCYAEANMIPNLYRSFDLNMPFEEVYQWLLISDEVDSILLAVEAISTWNWYRCFTISARNLSFDIDREVLNDLLDGLCSIRGWSRLPCSFCCYYFFGGSTSMSYLCLSREDPTYYYLTPEITRYAFGLDDLRKTKKFVFKFKHPAVGSCNLPGQCGFILETVRSNLNLWKLRLCTKEEDYASCSIHFHHEIRAENMHVFGKRRMWTDKKKNFSPRLLPLTWLGYLQEEEEKFNRFIEWTKNSSHSTDEGFGVMYKI